MASMRPRPVHVRHLASGSNIAWSEIGLSSICLVPLSVEAARVPRKGTPELFVDYGVVLTSP